MDVFIDLDGVLVDLEGGYKKLMGFSLPESHKRGMTSKEIWEGVEAKDEFFWLTLNKTKECDLILSYIEYLFGISNMNILSAHLITEKIKCISHKRAWVLDNTKLENKSINICHRRDKQKFAIGAILIDDNMLNITEWNSKGGVGIHYTNVFKLIRDLNELALHNKLNEL